MKQKETEKLDDMERNRKKHKETGKYRNKKEEQEETGRNRKKPEEGEKK